MCPVSLAVAACAPSGTRIRLFAMNFSPHQLPAIHRPDNERAVLQVCHLCSARHNACSCFECQSPMAAPLRA